jgi:thiosulfate reductase cytochrome b subunit
MKKFNQFMILQWLVFLPLILPLSIISGILQGIKHAVKDLVEQIMNDVSCPLIHEENPDSFA